LTAEPTLPQGCAGGTLVVKREAGSFPPRDERARATGVLRRRPVCAAGVARFMGARGATGCEADEAMTGAVGVTVRRVPASSASARLVRTGTLRFFGECGNRSGFIHRNFGLSKASVRSSKASAHRRPASARSSKASGHRRLASARSSKASGHRRLASARSSKASVHRSLASARSSKASLQRRLA